MHMQGDNVLKRKLLPTALETFILAYQCVVKSFNLLSKIIPKYLVAFKFGILHMP